MFLRLIGYKLLSNVRQKVTFFWCIAFPFILAILFSSCFGSLYDLNRKENLVTVGIVSDENSNTIIADTLDKSGFFSVERLDMDTAEKKKSEGSLDAIISINDNQAKIISNENDITSSILKSVVDTISQTGSAISNICTINPEGVTAELINDATTASYTQKHNESQNNDPYVIYFFALIAMTCLFTANIGLYSVNSIQANLSSIGARQCIAPKGKTYIFCSYFIADMLVQFVSVTALLFFIKYALKYNIGTISLRMLLFCYVAIFMSQSLGTFISSVFKFSANTKSGIITCITLVSCGASGLFSIDVKTILEDKIPALSYFNPGNIINDGLLSLYYLNDMSLYNRCILTLLIGGIVLFAGTYITLRRQKYASI